jgi:transcriptional regulator with XRE-family HTH domain
MIVKKIQILKKAVEKEGLSYTAKKLGIDRSTLNRYINGKIQRIPNDIIEKAAELLTIEELSDIIYGFRTVEIDPTTALSVIIKAVRDEGFRNFFISLIWQYLGVGLSLRFREFVFNLSSSFPLFPSPCRLRELNHSLQGHGEFHWAPSSPSHCSSSS